MSADGTYRQPLSYSPRNSSRQLKRRALWLVAALAFAAIAVLWLPREFTWMRYLYWERRALNYTTPAGHVVLDYDLAAHRVVFQEFDAVQAHIDRMPVVHRATGRAVVVFVHRLRTPAGKTVLGWLTLSVENGSSAILFSDCSRPASFFSLPVSYGGSLAGQIDLGPTARQLKVFAGQLDPTNPSHFTFDYEIDGQDRTVDCWLQNDMRVIASIRP